MLNTHFYIGLAHTTVMSHVQKPPKTHLTNFDILLTVHLSIFILVINRLTPNDPYMGRTALQTSKLCVLYIYSTNIGTEYFKHAL